MKIDLISFWNSSNSTGMAPYLNTTSEGGYISYEGVFSKVDLNSRIQSIMTALPDFFDSYSMKITDVNLGGILVSRAECVLKASSSSDVPDYTDILTSISNNLNNISNNLQSSSNSNSNTGIATILSNIFQYDNGYSSMRLNQVTSVQAKNRSNLIYMLLQIVNGLANNINVIDDAVFMPESKKYLSQILSCLKQSVSPKANITDVISSLNTNIHNDLTEINTTTDNKDTVLIVDGQQDFVIRKQDIDD